MGLGARQWPPSSSCTRTLGQAAAMSLARCTASFSGSRAPCALTLTLTHMLELTLSEGPHYRYNAESVHHDICRARCTLYVLPIYCEMRLPYWGASEGLANLKHQRGAPVALGNQVIEWPGLWQVEHAPANAPFCFEFPAGMLSRL